MFKIEYNGLMMTKQHIDGAMGVAGLSTSGLAKATGLARNTVIRFLAFDEDEKINPSTETSVMGVIDRGLAEKGWHFTESGGIAPLPSEGE